jgi:hypothetical protein
MPRIGIVVGGVAGTQLGLVLRKHGIAATMYSEKTPAQHLAARLTNVVVWNGLTRARERALGVDQFCTRSRCPSTPPHVGKLLVAAMQHQAIADFYTDGFNHPDHVWKVRSSAERTESVAKLLAEGPPPAMPIASDRIASFVSLSGAGG